MQATIALQDALPVDEDGLAIVIANALENAIHACQELPAGQREIRCKMVDAPGIMLEISNPCAGGLSFDSNGLPVAQRKGVFVSQGYTIGLGEQLMKVIHKL